MKCFVQKSTILMHLLLFSYIVIDIQFVFFSVGSYMLMNYAPFLPENHIHSLVHVFRKARFILFKTCQSLFLKRYFFSLKKYWIYMPTCVYKTKQNKKVKIFSSWNFEIWKLFIFLLINSHHLCYISFCCIYFIFR